MTARISILLLLCGACSTGGSRLDAGPRAPVCDEALPLTGVAVAPHVLVAEEVPVLPCQPRPGDYVLVQDRSYLGPTIAPGTLPGTLRQRLRLGVDGTYQLTNQDADGGPLQVFAGFWNAVGETLTTDETCPATQRSRLSCGHTDAGLLVGDPGSRVRHVYAPGP